MLWYQNRCQVSFFFMLALYWSLKFSDFDNIRLKLMRKLWRKMHPWSVLEEPGVNVELLGPSSTPIQTSRSIVIGPFFQHHDTFKYRWPCSKTSTFKTWQKKYMCLVIPPLRLFVRTRLFSGHLERYWVTISFWGNTEKNKPFSASKHAGMLWQFNSFTVVWSETSENGKFIPCHPN